MDTAFRKINIDALEEDILLPSDLYDPDPRGPAGVLSDAKSKSAEVRQLVSRWVLADELGAMVATLAGCHKTSLEGPDASDMFLSSTSQRRQCWSAQFYPD
jgi:hypothetical protein